MAFPPFDHLTVLHWDYAVVLGTGNSTIEGAQNFLLEIWETNFGDSLVNMQDGECCDRVQPIPHPTKMATSLRMQRLRDIWVQYGKMSGLQSESRGKNLLGEDKSVEMNYWARRLVCRERGLEGLGMKEHGKDLSCCKIPRRKYKIKLVFGCLTLVSVGDRQPVKRWFLKKSWGVALNPELHSDSEDRA